jgi:hypothetical protein
VRFGASLEAQDRTPGRGGFVLIICLSTFDL